MKKSAKTKPLIDKSDWGSGPWRSEPDELSWIDELTGYLCHILRMPETGQLNGYVTVPVTSAVYGKDYDDVDVHVHGGLTYAKHDEDGWRYGFDCAHLFDLCPGMSHRWLSRYGGRTDHSGDVYRDMEYVKAECASLARQLKALA